MNSNMDYKRISTGLNKYKLYPVDQEFDIYKLIDIDKNQDYYEGVYTYKDKHYNKWKKERTLSGIQDVKTDKILFDFDSNGEVSFEDARSSTSTLVGRLVENGMPQEYIQVYFSGSKGFHVQINIDEWIERREFENIVFNLAQDLKGFDTKIRDQQRLIRIPFTKRPNLDQRKIPITLEELKNISKDKLDVISLDCTEDRIALFEDWQVHIPLSDKLIKLKNKDYQDNSKNKTQAASEVVISNIAVSDNNEELDLTEKPPWIDAARYALKEGFFIEGQRNDAFCILAAYYRKMKFTKEDAIAMLNVTRKKQAERYGVEEYSFQEMLTRNVNWAYSKTWNGGIYSRENELLQEKIIQFGLQEELGEGTTQGPRPLSEIIETEFEKLKDTSKRVLTGFKEIDKDLIIEKEMLVSIIGFPSSGKTTWLNQLLHNIARQDHIVLYESLDMTAANQAIKLINYNASNPKSAVEYWEMARDGASFDELEKAKDKAVAATKNIYAHFVETGMNDIIEHAYDIERQTGRLPSVIAIDYLEQVSSENDNDYQKYNDIISKFSAFCKKKGILGIMLLQPNKRSADGSKFDIDVPIDVGGIKYGGKITQNSRVIWSICRPGARTDNSTDDKFMQVDTIKTNIGPQNSYIFNFDGKRGSVWDASPEDKKELKAIKRRKDEYDDDYL